MLDYREAKCHVLNRNNGENKNLPKYLLEKLMSRYDVAFLYQKNVLKSIKNRQ